jgi:predicted DNA-binding protein with PD1-like motif
MKNFTHRDVVEVAVYSNPGPRSKFSPNIMARFADLGGVSLLHVPYRGAGPALIDLLAGQVQVMFDALPSSIGYIKVKLGWLNWETKQYEPSVSLDEQVELLSLIGDVALKDDEPQVHAHAVIGKRDGTAHGGHLLEAHVRPTCEVVLTESPAHLKKEFDPAAGIVLIKL